MRTASLRIVRVGGDQWDRFVWDHLVLSCVYSSSNVIQFTR
jgi:hypothetical protein